jgi:rhodanese-related sulfurtransferase
VPDRISEILKDKIIGVRCSSGVRSTMVYLYLRVRGFNKVRLIEGGYAELGEEFNTGKLLKHFFQNGGKK